MMHSWVKSGVAGVFRGTGMHRLVPTMLGLRNIPVVIGYHRVVEDYASSVETSLPPQLVSLKMLERHLDWMGQRFHFVTLDEAGAQIESCKTSSRPMATVTFDDGYKDFHDLAFPLLQKKGIPAAVFVVTDLVDTTEVQLHDKLYLLLKRRLAKQATLSIPSLSIPDISGLSPYHATRALLEGLPTSAVQKVIEVLGEADSLPEATWSSFHSLTWEALDRLRRGGITIGSHTKSHALLPNESQAQLRIETAASRKKLEATLGTSVRHFAFPSGAFNTTALRAVAAAGYHYAYTACPHRSPQYPLLTIPRTLLWERSSIRFDQTFSGTILNCQIHHVFDAWAGCRRSHRRNEDITHAQSN
jgi:peptidoglycan/xylan/chitin deacetylase (PgdA/CDA1 family)